MALNIKDAETDRLARELAELTGQSITVALREALQDKLAVARARRAVAGTDDLQAIIDRGRARRILDDRTSEDIVGYDEHGLPA
ncbi:type II toxin-antitoxin system VapB family antitoxin [Nocardioides sambongensis]|uniref:type II toxin-antitoxin system VapB family antitoxin n=1 Tax=Nocardioides sambongensis TaxID=2589074 RepID=UPI00112E91E0|nr:type II toxin-antitoxin system VapB family antitoxin [Nocardioides sambongensis]